VAVPEIEGDPVIARRDTPTSYHLSVTVDDHLQGVTLVTRGEDLFQATHVHRLLQALLGYEPPDYHHHALLTNDAGERLSKRDGATAIRVLREQGATPEQVRTMAGCQ
jgi:glutamyl-Q tRNA(Asp) synthetase